MRAGIALGSNLGNRLDHLQSARADLARLATAGSTVLSSPVYETPPVDCPPGSPAFLNAVVELDWDGGPASLLEHTQGIEFRHGRRRRGGETNAPRTLDLDILYAGDSRIDTPGLSLPHPRIASRRFVLQPLADLRPALRLPGFSVTIRRLLTILESGSPEDGPRLVARVW